MCINSVGKSVVTDLAGIVVDKYMHNEHKRRTTCSSMYTQIVCNYEFTDDFHEYQLGKLGIFVLKIVLHYESESEGRNIATLSMINHQLGKATLPDKQSSIMPSLQQPSIISEVKNWGQKITTI